MTLEAKCAADGCGKTMAEHPVYSPDHHRIYCEAFIDPDFVAGNDRDEDVEPDTFVPCTRAPACKLGLGHLTVCSDGKSVYEPHAPNPPVQGGYWPGVPPRSEMHGVSVGGYADVNIPPRTMTGDEYRNRLGWRKLEIERVQPAFKCAWQSWYLRAIGRPGYPVWKDKWEGTYFQVDRAY